MPNPTQLFYNHNTQARVIVPAKDKTQQASLQNVVIDFPPPNLAVSRT